MATTQSKIGITRKKSSLVLISQTRILSASLAIQSRGDFRIDLDMVGVDGELVMIGRYGDFVADDRHDEVWHFTTRLLGAVGLVGLELVGLDEFWGLPWKVRLQLMEGRKG